MDNILKLPDSLFAATYNWEYLTIVITAFCISFVMAFWIGANDVANSFGTTVGSRVLTIGQACLFAVVFETLGAVILGNHVSDTLWKDMVDISIYRGQEKLLVLGEISALIGTAVWVMLATLVKIPVSGTHAIVGATVGFTVVSQGQQGIIWWNVGRIGLSWFLSPLLAGMVSGAFFVLIRRFILDAGDAVESGLKYMPLLYGLTIFINFMTVFLDGWLIPGFLDRMPWWATLILSSGMAILTGLLVRFYFVPKQRRKISALLEVERAHRVSFRRHRIVPEVEDGREVEPPVPRMRNRVNSIDSQTSIHLARNSSSSRRSSRKLRRRESSPHHALNALEKEEFMRENSFRRGSLKGHRHRHESETSDHEHHGQFRPRAFSDSQKSRKNSREPGSATTTSVHNLPPDLISECVVEVLREEGNLNEETIVHNEEPSENPDQPRASIADSARENWHKIRHALLCGESRRTDHDQVGIASIFSYLQMLTSALTAFAHGGNDVCNAVGPLVGVWSVFTNARFRDDMHTPIWLLCFGGFGISVGLCVLGRKVIETVGTTLSTVLPSSGFCIGLGTACTVLIASKFGIPVSTTHCVIGSVVAVGWLRAPGSVNWRIFGSIMGCALLTLPVAAGFGAASMALLLLIPGNAPPSEIPVLVN